MSTFSKNINISLQNADDTPFVDATIYNNLTDIVLEKELLLLIDECSKHHRESQKKMYSVFYNYAANICLRYANDKEDTVEILNDGFLKIFNGLKDFKPHHANTMGSFKAWMKKIFIYTAIDHFRKNTKHKNYIDIEEAYTISATDETQLEKISYREIMECIQTLTPAYRTVFSLFVIDGFSHEEISKQLNIAVGTSKSNLAKARLQLQKKLLAKQNINVYEQRAVR